MKKFINPDKRIPDNIAVLAFTWPKYLVQLPKVKLPYGRN
jgi:hypothetical protein